MFWIGPITDHERTNPSSSARTIAPAATPMNRARELAKELAFRAIEILDLLSRPVRQRSRVLVEVAREQLRVSTQRQHLADRPLVLDRRALVERDELLLHQPPELIGRDLDPSKDVLIFWRRRESESIRGRARLEPLGLVHRDLIHGERERPACLGAPSGQTTLKSGPAFSARTPRRYPAAAWILLYSTARCLEKPNARDAIVRLAEHELAEQAHRDEQHGRADERDQELRPNLHRQAGNGPDEWIPDPSPPLPGDPRLLLLGQDQTSRTVVPPTMFVISHFPSIRATSKSAVVVAATSPVLTST